MTKDKAAERLDDKNKHYEACKQAYRDLKVYSGDCEVKDTGEGLGSDQDTSMEAVELDDLPTLHKGSYVMDQATLGCLIYKADRSDSETFEAFHFLESVTHPALVRHHTFYKEKIGKRRLPRIVLSGVDCPFGDLLRTDQASKRFSTSTKTGPALTQELLTMIIDLCSGIEHLFKHGLYPPKLGLRDLYLCKDGPSKYRLQLLVLKVEELERKTDQSSRMAELWKQVKDMVEEIRELTKIDEWNKVNERFINYIGHDVSLLVEYPLSWTYHKKGRYLMSIASVEESVVRSKLQKSGLKWADGNSPKLIDLLVAHDKKRLRPYNYCTTDPFDYMILCRTAYKHYPTLSEKITHFKDMCPRQEDFLKQMEKWEPLIWCILYEAIGSVGRLECSTSDKSNGSG